MSCLIDSPIIHLLTLCAVIAYYVRARRVAYELRHHDD
jgi:hypothetical protein